MAFSAERLKQKAVELGFNLVGITPAVPSPTLHAYEQWVAQGMHGTMGYLARPDRLARRRDLNVILPGVESLVVVGLDYRVWLPEDLLADPSRGRFASYAWGLDYHDVMTPRLNTLADWLARESGEQLNQRAYVDTGALLERSHAHEAGLGFVGKNTMLIHPRRGSYFFLGELLTTIAFDEYDQADAASRCGSCTRCLAACPTNAFPKPFTLDARRCISYLTIEHKGWIDPALRPLMGNYVYGCDICQDVCPWQRFSHQTSEPAFRPADLDQAAPPLPDLLALDAAGFRARFAGSAVERVGRDRLVRNACIAAGNWGSPVCVGPLSRLLDDPNPLVRGHATWALGQIDDEDARQVLSVHQQREEDQTVQAEIQAIIT